jgi:hypothetical protein
MTKIPLLVNAWGWLAGVDPSLPWFLIPLLAWLVNLAVRTWAPKFWERLASLGPSGVTAGKAFEALPAVAFGAALAALSGHGDPRGLMHAALAGLIAPVWHEALKQFVPGYLGGAFPAAGGATPPLDSTPAAKGGTVSLLLLVILLPGCAGSLQAARVEGAPARSETLQAAPDKVAATAACQSTDSKHRTWATVAEVLGVLGGGSGIGGLVVEAKKDQDPRDRDWGRGLAVTAVVVGGASAGATYLATSYATDWARECSGQ